MKKVSVGILGATGMVGQRFLALLDHHPWFDVTHLAASPRSAGKNYSDAVEGRWLMNSAIPEYAKKISVEDVEKDCKSIASDVDLVFSALDMEKEQIKTVENNYAKQGVGVVSNNSAHRWTDDVPMIMPEINPEHAAIIDAQRKHHQWEGFIAVKPNCSIQSYVPAIHALKGFKPQKISVTTLQAISGAGKTFRTFPEILDNIIPFIKGEEEKSEKEPLKIWGSLNNGKIEMAKEPHISATCLRAPVSDGHMASVFISFKDKPTREDMLSSWKNFHHPLEDLHLPSEPTHFMNYFDQDDRPQTKLDRDVEHGMGISIGRLREDPLFDWKFVSLSHNTIRGAAGGAILVAELLRAKKYF